MLRRISFTYNQAIVRTPPRSCVGGLRANGAGAPNFDLYLQQHAMYVAALEKHNVSVIVLPALEKFPDCMFVEDTALCLPQGAVILKTATPSRIGEVDMVRVALQQIYGERCVELPQRGEFTNAYIEGGDILVTDREIIVGLSRRTNLAGVNALRMCVKDWGFEVRIVETPQHVLHFKSGSAVLDDGVIICTVNLASSNVFKGYDLLIVPDDEEVPATVLRVNRTVFMVAGYPKTKRALEMSGYRVHILDMSEAAKLDGGLSCMSLRFDVGKF
ncbi:MAG: dimethylarginine dimethylaminohydrolase [Robiginitomaculum sp.]|nr:MAG: dimethylarginine dimethylaminohydrolase [Robiginitomaculum sp.]